jgi:hypothetical protein
MPSVSTTTARAVATAESSTVLPRIVPPPMEVAPLGARLVSVSTPRTDARPVPLVGLPATTRVRSTSPGLLALWLNRTTPMRSLSFNSDTYTLAAWMARSLLDAPGTPVGSLMLPERSMTRTESTGGGPTARATRLSATEEVTGSSEVVTVSVPEKSGPPDSGERKAA